MASFSVTVQPCTILPHPNADALELAQIADYLSIVRKGTFQTGDLVAYIPEDSIVPEPILETLGLQGKLSGPEKNRVKAMRLRGILSQGLVLPAHPEWTLGQDVTAELGIAKYEPPIPTGFSGECKNVGTKNTVAYDIENIKAFPVVFVEGDSVVMTEKIHGTCAQFILLPAGSHPEGFTFAAASKGLGAQGLVFPICDANHGNVYVRIAITLNIEAKMRAFFGENLSEPVILLGEIFGAKIQDLGYGCKTPTLRVFDIATGFRGRQRFYEDSALEIACAELQLPRVPIIYRGPFSKNILGEMTRGKETISGQEVHIREGVVVRPTEEREHPTLGRVQLKSVAEDYILRKGGTEFN